MKKAIIGIVVILIFGALIVGITTNLQGDDEYEDQAKAEVTEYITETHSEYAEVDGWDKVKDTDMGNYHVVTGTVMYNIATVPFDSTFSVSIGKVDGEWVIGELRIGLKTVYHNDDDMSRLMEFGED